MARSADNRWNSLDTCIALIIALCAFAGIFLGSVLDVSGLSARAKANRRHEVINRRVNIMIELRKLAIAQDREGFSAEQLEKALNVLATSQYGAGHGRFSVRQFEGQLWILEVPQPARDRVWVMDYDSGEAWLVPAGREMEHITRLSTQHGRQIRRLCR